VKGVNQIVKKTLKSLKVEKLYQVGHIAFLTGIIIAIVVGLVAPSLANVLADLNYSNPDRQAALFNESAAITLILLGLLVGIVNITSKEVTEFLVASIALLVIANSIQFAFAVRYVGVTLSSIIGFVNVFVAPAALITAIKAVYDLASRR